MRTYSEQKAISIWSLPWFVVADGFETQKGTKRIERNCGVFEKCAIEWTEKFFVAASVN